MYVSRVARLRYKNLVALVIIARATRREEGLVYILRVIVVRIKKARQGGTLVVVCLLPWVMASVHAELRAVDRGTSRKQYLPKLGGIMERLKAGGLLLLFDAPKAA